MGVGKWAKEKAAASTPGKAVKGAGTVISFLASRGPGKDVVADGRPDVVRIKGGGSKAKAHPLHGAIATLVGMCAQADKSSRYRPNEKVAGKKVIRSGDGKQLLIAANKAKELEALAGALTHFGVAHVLEQRGKSHYLVVDVAANAQLRQQFN